MRSASRSPSRPWGVSIVNPTLVRIGGGSAAQTKNRYHGTPSSDRSTPNTSQATASSNGATPSRMTAATVLRELAAFFLIEAILPLFEWLGKAQHDCMFLVYCPRHQAQMLLFVDDIVELINHDHGIDVHWRCSCGAEGVQHGVSRHRLART